MGFVKYINKKLVVVPHVGKFYRSYRLSHNLAKFLVPTLDTLTKNE